MQHLCEVQVLGGFAVTVDGRRVEGDAWRSRRAADLVKVLALEPAHELHREEVMDALWPSLTVAAGAANLRKAVHYARRALGSEDAIFHGDGMIQLWPDADVNVDRDRFMAEAAGALASSDAAECGHVAAGYAGGVLPADRYEPWVQRPGAETHETYVHLLKAGGEWRAVLALDETDEEAHRALMQAQLDAGNRREAIRQFERLRDVLREHIGVGPDPTTVALYEKVLAMEGDEPTSPSERAAALLANGLVA
jgi:DNA-binding SARP family transcriptional activator